MPPLPPHDVALLLPSPFAALPDPLQARRSCSRTSAAEYSPERARSLQGCPKTGAVFPGRPPLRFHPPHSTRTAKPHLFSSLPLPAAGTESVSWRLLRNRGGEAWTNPKLPGSMPPALDRLTHIESASACPLARVVPKQNHPRIPPSSESWIADVSPHRSDRAALRRASAPRSLQIPYSSSSPNRW